MSIFKQLVRRDIHNVFLDTRIFADMHEINDRMMPAQIDYNENIEREKRYSDRTDGMYQVAFVVYVAAADYGRLPSYDSTVKLDGRFYTVQEATEEDGMYAITLVANRGRGR